MPVPINELTSLCFITIHAFDKQMDGQSELQSHAKTLRLQLQIQKWILSPKHGYKCMQSVSVPVSERD